MGLNIYIGIKKIILSVCNSTYTFQNLQGYMSLNPELSQSDEGFNGKK